MFSYFKLTTSSGKHSEDFSHTHIVFLTYKLKSSSRGIDDLPFGFDIDRGKRKIELAFKQNIKGYYHLRIMTKNVFAFAKCQQKCTNGYGYKLTLTKNKDGAVTDKVAGIDDVRFKIDQIHWYVPHYIPSLQQKSLLSNQILGKTLKELRYIERSVFMKEVISQNLWNFELGGQESMNVPIWINIGFQHKKGKVHRIKQ